MNATKPDDFDPLRPRAFRAGAGSPVASVANG